MAEPSHDRPPGFPLCENTVEKVFRFLPPQDRSSLAQACKYTARIAREYHVYSDIHGKLSEASTAADIARMVKQRRKSIEINGPSGLFCFFTSFTREPYQVCESVRRRWQCLTVQMRQPA